MNSTFSFPFEDKAFFSSFLFILKDLLASFEVVALSDTALPEEVEQLYFPTASFSSLFFRGLDSSSSALLIFEIVSITRNNEEFFNYFYRYKIWHSIYSMVSSNIVNNSSYTCNIFASFISVVLCCLRAIFIRSDLGELTFLWSFPSFPFSFEIEKKYFLSQFLQKTFLFVFYYVDLIMSDRDKPHNIW